MIYGKMKREDKAFFHLIFVLVMSQEKTPPNKSETRHAPRLVMREFKNGL